MTVPRTLSGYLARHFLVWVGGAYAAMLALVLLIEVVELLRRASAKEEATFAVVLDMALLRLPFLAQKLVPYAVLFGGMTAFWRLTRSRELVVVRAAGLSVWQFLLPALGLAFLIGVITITTFNPVAAVMQSRYEQLESKYLRGRSSLLAVSSTGVWLRQLDPGGQSVIHSQRASLQTMEFSDVIIFLFEGRDKFIGRIDAASATLRDGFWQIKDAWFTGTDRPARFESTHALKTDLTLDKIQDAFASPQSISFWELPGFAGTLESAGFSGLRHRLYWHSLLADPIVLCAMVLFAAAFTLRPAIERGATLMMVGGGVLTGFVLFFLSDVVFALGLSASVPVALAAWTPAVASVMVGLTLLLHLEER
ncbi:MAG: LPS export ABC transporter permease LptG [Alphaproteobacteria bacterium]